MKKSYEKIFAIIVALSVCMFIVSFTSCDFFEEEDSSSTSSSSSSSSYSSWSYSSSSSSSN